MAKKFKRFGVMLLSAAVLTAAATTISPAVPVIGVQVVHANDAVEDTTLSFRMNGYDFSEDPDGYFIETLDDVVLYDIPIGQPYEFTLPDFEGYEFHEWFYYNSGELVSGENQTISFDQVERDYGVMASYAKIQPSTDPVDGVDPKDPDTDPADGGNADTGGGNSTSGDTQTPPADNTGDAGADTSTSPVDNNGGDTGSQDQTPPADGTGGDTQTPPADNTGDTGTDTSTPPVDTSKPQTLTVVETRQDENGAVLFTKTHSLVLNPGEEKDLGYNPDREVLVRGGNLYRYGNFEDGATLYFTTRLKPAAANTDPANGGNAGGDIQTPSTPVDTGETDTGGGDNGSTDTTTPPPADNASDTGSQDQASPADVAKTQTLTVVETRQDENVKPAAGYSSAGVKALPSTGDGSSILSVIGGLAALASSLVFARRKKGAK